MILRLHDVPFMDIAGLQTLHEVIVKLRKRGIRVLLCEANARVLTKLDNAKVLDALEPGDYCTTLDDAIAREMGIALKGCGASHARLRSRLRPEAAARTPS